MHKINLYIKFLVTWREQDSNLRPRDYEPRELPNCSTPRINFEAHCRIRTDDICFTKAMLWPTELSRQIISINTIFISLNIKSLL